MIDISIVTPVYKSAPFIREFFTRHLQCIEKLNLSYEFIFVNDGSPDNSEDIIKNLISESPNIKLVSLSRNFGQQAAIFAGLNSAEGNYIYTSDCDLEETPENLIDFYHRIIKSADCDSVFGIVKNRRGGLIKGFFGKCFYSILNLISDVKITPNQSWQRIMTKRYVKELLKFSETETISAGILALVGFKQEGVLTEKSYKGASSYSPFRRFKLAINSLLSYSSKPLIAIGLMGLTITALSFIFVGIIFFRKIYFNDAISGWTSLICSIWVVGGLILSSIGMLGMYLAKIFNKVKNRPPYIVKYVKSKNSDYQKNLPASLKK